MPIINHRQFGKKPSGRTKRSWRPALWTLGGLAAVFILANLIVIIAYHNKALPKYSVGATHIGGKSYGQIDDILRNQTLPKSVTLQHGATRKSVSLSSMNISIDRTKTMKAIRAKPLFPIFSLVSKHVIPIELAADKDHVAETLAGLGSEFSQRSTDKHVAFNGTTFVAADATAGYAFDQGTTAQTILTTLSNGKTSVTVATKTLAAGSNAGDVSADVKTLQKQLSTRITFNYGDKKVAPSTADEGSWFASSGKTMELSDANVGAYVDKAASQLGITAKNKKDLITAVKYALGRNIPMNFEVSPPSAISRTYCTGVRGVSAAELPDLIGKLAATYADVHGWNDGGKISFDYAPSNCDYTVFLSSPAEMASFGSICDDYYNCQVDAGVVVNNDRWLYATDPWNKTGQDLETYRTLIIDHESGHRLGYYDNPTCPGTGQLAPVMMQQSIDLKGCTFNVWPLQSELDGLHSQLGIL